MNEFVSKGKIAVKSIFDENKQNIQMLLQNKHASERYEETFFISRLQDVGYIPRVLRFVFCCTFLVGTGSSSLELPKIEKNTCNFFDIAKKFQTRYFIKVNLNAKSVAN